MRKYNISAAESSGFHLVRQSQAVLLQEGHPVLKTLGADFHGGNTVRSSKLKVILSSSLLRKYLQLMRNLSK